MVLHNDERLSREKPILVTIICYVDYSPLSTQIIQPWAFTHRRVFLLLNEVISCVCSVADADASSSYVIIEEFISRNERCAVSRNTS